MHYEILIEDASGKAALDILLPKIIGHQHTSRVISYRGIGHIPKDLNRQTDVQNRILLERLPNILRGYGKTYTDNHVEYSTVLFIVCDLDGKCLSIFRQTLLDVLDKCKPKIETRFCIAIEEGEAWLLGDIPAIKQAYPNAKLNILQSYSNDSICDTWELLADAIVSGGSSKLKKEGWQAVGKEKSTWAERITPYMKVERNSSPSFCYFRNKIQEFI